MRRFGPSLVLCTTVVTPVFANGTDSCTTPTVVTGSGPFSFDNSSATTGALTQGQSESLCNITGGTAVVRDVWFQWQAPADGTATAYTCGQTTVNTKIAAYAGTTCPGGGTALACGDDDCGFLFQSSISFSCTSGSWYVFQIGSSPGAAGGAGTFRVDVNSIPPNDECTTPLSISGSGPFAFDNTSATTGTAGQSEALCNSGSQTAIHKDLWYRYAPTANGCTVTISTCGLIPSGSVDSKIAVYAGTACPTSGTAIACNDSFCGAGASVSFTANCSTAYLIQIGTSGATTSLVGAFSLNEAGGTSCVPPTTAFCLGDSTGSPCPCANQGNAGHGCANSGYAGGALLSMTGIAGASDATDTLTLRATGVTGPGLFIQSDGILSNPILFGDGHLCAAINIIRLGVVFPIAGVSTYPNGTTANPIHTQGLAYNTQIKHYQLWYRDSEPSFCTVSTFNLSQGLSLIWGP